MKISLTVTKLHVRNKEHKYRFFWLWRATLILLAFIIALPLSGAVYERVMAFGDVTRYPAPGRLVDVGGYHLHLNCIGQGSPTIVLSSGAGGYSTEWSVVQPTLARAQRVCSYDRAGLGWSETGPGQRSPGDAANDLHRLLLAAGERGPYVLVGQSLGGRAVRLFAQRHPELVAGVVLLDPRSEYVDDHQTPEQVAAERQEAAAFQQQLAVLSPIGVVRLIWASVWPQVLPVAGKLTPAAREEMGILWSKAKHRQARLEETSQMRASNDELRDASLGDMPLVVIAAGDTLAHVPHWQEAQAYEAARSRNSRLVIAEGSHHMIQWDQPEVVVDAVQAVIVAARNGQPFANK
jgi:pimeloyl-ACP methyl ester carboxylesterase